MLDIAAQDYSKFRNEPSHPSKKRLGDPTRGSHSTRMISRGEVRI